MPALTGPIIQSAINLSEGRRADVLEALVAAVQGIPGVVTADWSADPDHNRMVLTLLGGPDLLPQAALALARAAVARIDLRQHTGAHPRLGAVDVVPLVPIRGATMEDCIAAGARIGQDFARELALPVYFYERSAAPGRHVALPEIRKGGFEGLFLAPLTGLRAPDLGPAAPHSTAGAVVVGARAPLVACNIMLDTPDVAIARRISAAIRRRRDTFPPLAGVRALGLFLPSRQQAQVSMNLTRPAQTPFPPVFDFVRRMAAELGAQTCETEFIGLIPRAVLGGMTPESLLWRGGKPSQILESWLE